MDNTEKEMNMITYRIFRSYQRNDMGNEEVATGLTLAEARAHCSDPETSSRTATSDEAVARTQEHGAWFEGYAEEQ